MKLVSDHGRCFGDVTLGETRMTASTIWAYGGDVDAFMREYPALCIKRTNNIPYKNKAVNP